MSFDREDLELRITQKGPVARVVIAEIGGSTPREVGAAMLVWPEGQSGTIGGGSLEFAATARARDAIATGKDRLDRHALGPSLGQCCGGSVTVVTEIWDLNRLKRFEGDVIARPIPGKPPEMPLAAKRIVSQARDRGEPVAPALIGGWLIEPVSRPTRALWVYGSGHVGRAIVAVMAPLPEISVTWVDTSEDRFPSGIPDGVTKLVAASPSQVVRFAPSHGEHLILTYSHEMDLEICHALLGHGFEFAGLIGSKTKWARFRKRLIALGHSEHQVDRILCPIGERALGKHPQAIAIGVAGALLRLSAEERAEKDAAG